MFRRSLKPPPARQHGADAADELHCHLVHLADAACEDALYDIAAFRDFCGIDLGRKRVPDTTTLLNFHHLLEEHRIGAVLFAQIGELLLANGMHLSGGTIVEATLIARPSSTKNAAGKRAPEMHQSKRATNGTLA